MPIYQYKCQKCGEIEEILQQTTELKKLKCANCNNSMEKIISPVGIIFKGKGFHINDYSSSSKQ